MCRKPKYIRRSLGLVPKGQDSCNMISSSLPSRYEELVKKVKKVVEKIDKGAVKEHAAIEIDIEGEGEGAFYVELDKDKVAVEPYEYYDNDCRIRTGAETLIDLVTGKLDAVKALEDGKISVDGDIEKALVLSDVLKATVNKKSSEIKKPATASKPATSKKATNKKASSK